MANLILKPSTGGILKIQNDDGTVDALTINTAGNLTAAGTLGVTGNTTLSGTANNLGTVASGNLSNNAIIMPRIKEMDYFMVWANVVTTTPQLQALNISGSSYIEVTPESTGDIIEFGHDCAHYYTAGYYGWGIERATNTGFSSGKTTIWCNGEHTQGPADNMEGYTSQGGVVTGTASEFGMSADTTYYCRMIGPTHSGTTSIYFSQRATNSVHQGTKLTMKRWSIV